MNKNCKNCGHDSLYYTINPKGAICKTCTLGDTPSNWIPEITLEYCGGISQKIVDDVIGSIRPPLGLKPKNIHERQRAIEIIKAMERYVNAEKPIPHDWFAELEYIAGEGE